MIETGNLRFGGDVTPEQCSFGGLGATGNEVSADSRLIPFLRDFNAYRLCTFVHTQVMSRDS